VLTHLLQETHNSILEIKKRGDGLPEQNLEVATQDEAIPYSLV
jgi:hypothetical protein